MINLTGKSVFVKTQEEYENILNIARLQGFDKWPDKVSLSSRNIKLPNILIFKDNGTVAYWSDKGVLEASEIIEYEENDNGLCDRKGILIEEDDTCEKHTENWMNSLMEKFIRESMR